MPVSTPSRCLRSESLWIHSSTSVQASSRVGDTTEQGIHAAARTSRHMAFDTLRRPLGRGKAAGLPGGGPPPGRGKAAGSAGGGAPPIPIPGTDPRMEKFIIEGGTPLSGTVVAAGNKNAALPALAATLLTREEVVLRNIPNIRDVQAMVELLV